MGSRLAEQELAQSEEGPHSSLNHTAPVTMEIIVYS